MPLGFTFHSSFLFKFVLHETIFFLSCHLNILFNNHRNVLATRGHYITMPTCSTSVLIIFLFHLFLVVSSPHIPITDAILNHLHNHLPLINCMKSISSTLDHRHRLLLTESISLASSLHPCTLRTFCQRCHCIYYSYHFAFRTNFLIVALTSIFSLDKSWMWVISGDAPSLKDLPWFWTDPNFLYWVLL